MRIAAAVVAVPLIGCFYTDPINERPSLEIRHIGMVKRNETAHFTALVHDDEPGVDLHWRAFTCTADGATCDETPFVDTTYDELTAMVPDQYLGAPVQAIKVRLEGRDHYRAAAPPVERLFAVEDTEPTVSLSSESSIAGLFRPGIAVTVSATVSDLEDHGDAIAVDPTVRDPMGNELELTTLPETSPAAGRYEWSFVPDKAGGYRFDVDATDPLHHTAHQRLTVTVGDDQPACLDRRDPAADAGTLIVSSNRRFVVESAVDDLDPFPDPDPGDDRPTQAQFHWFATSPAGGALVDAGDGPDFVLVPSHYAPGAQVEIRVEVSDRVARTLPCDAAAPTCSIGGDGCLQRFTWRAEIR